MSKPPAPNQEVALLGTTFGIAFLQVYGYDTFRERVREGSHADRLCSHSTDDQSLDLQLDAPHARKKGQDPLFRPFYGS